MASLVRDVLRATVTLDPAGLQGRDGLRTALGVGVPLVVGVALDRPLDGLAAAGGAFAAGFALFAVGYRTRLSAVLLATVGVACSTFVGAAVGDVLWLFALTTAVWGFAAGMLVSLGVAAGIIGVQSVVGLLVITQYSMPLEDGLGRAGLVLLGGGVQVLLLLTAWPLRRSPFERSTLATVYRSLGAYAAALPTGVAEPPDVRPLAEARRALRDPQPFLRDEHAQLFSQLHDEAEHVRTTLAGLALVRGRLVGWPSRERAVVLLDELALEVAGLLRDIAVAAELPRSAARSAALTAAGPEGAPERWERLARATAALRGEAAAAGPSDTHVGASLVGEVERLATALLGHLEAVVRLSRAAAGPLSLDQAGPQSTRARSTAVQDALPTLRAHLTLRSAVLRHALRLAGTLGVGTALAGLLPSEHRYWLPLTALVVLKPDFRSTFTRGIGRILGTAVGALLAGLVTALLEPGPLVLTVLVVAAAWGCYALLFANYALFGLCVTAFVVFLLSFAALPGWGTVLDRLEATVLGGVLALVAYVVWPTWERVRVPEQLARLLEAQARYGAALLEQYADLSQLDLARLEELRAAARLARSNAEASVARLASEPLGRRGGLAPEQARAVREQVRAYALAALALQAHLPEARPVAVEPQLRVLAQQLRSSLGELAAALRDGRPPEPPAQLLQARRDLAAALDVRVRADPTTALDAAVLDVETLALAAAAAGVADALAGRQERPR